jgi:hypothetical protein
VETSSNSEITFQPMFNRKRRVFNGLDASRGKKLILFLSRTRVVRKPKDFMTSSRGSGCDNWFSDKSSSFKLIKLVIADGIAFNPMLCSLKDVML